jgi:hypothetical protein
LSSPLYRKAHPNSNESQVSSAPNRRATGGWNIQWKAFENLTSDWTRPMKFDLVYDGNPDEIDFIGRVLGFAGQRSFPGVL